MSGSPPTPWRPGHSAAGRRQDAGRAAQRALDAVVGDRLRSGRRLASVAGGAIAFPIAVLVHELAHFTAFAAFGFPDPVLRFSSTSWSGSGEFARHIRAGDVEAAAALVQPWQVAVGVAAGVIVTNLTSHRLRACSPPIRPRRAFSGSRSRAGDPAALAGGDWPHLPLARILVPRDRHSSRPEDARRRPDAGGQRGCGWPPCGSCGWGRCFFPETAPSSHSSARRFR